MASNLLRKEELTFARDGARIKAYAAWLRRDERLPAVVLLHDVRGLSAHYKEIAERFAREGFFALALDLYSREGAPLLPNMDAVFSWMRSLDDVRVMADISAAIRFLSSRPEVRARSIGITGFCMGGQYALMAACASEGLAACVSFYGMLRYSERSELKPNSPLDLAADLKVPYLGLFGDEDALIPRADVKELESILRKNNKTFQTKIYAGAGHAFFNDQRLDAYRPDAAKDAWQRTLQFLRANLAPH